MVKTAQTLSRIVALKRQKAEQSLALLQAALRHARDDLAQLDALLASSNNVSHDFETLKLATQNGHLRRVLHDIDRKKAEIAGIENQLDEAREALKQILMSEDELSKMNAARR